jgi:hypothetical protein
VRDYLFYQARCGTSRGVGRIVVTLRRLSRRLLLPFFQRLVVVLEEMDRDREQLAERHGRLESVVQEQAAIIQHVRQELTALTARQTNLEALQLDQEALARRLAALEDLVERLLEQRADRCREDPSQAA